MTIGLDSPSRAHQHEAEPYPPLRQLSPFPGHWHSLPRAFIDQARSIGARTALADSTGTSLTYGQTLLRALVLGRVLAREWGPAEHVGLFVPPTVPAAVANLAVSPLGQDPRQSQLLGQPGASRLLDRPVRNHARFDLGQSAR